MSDADVLESTQFEDLVESLKQNKEINERVAKVSKRACPHNIEHCGEANYKGSCGLLEGKIWKDQT